MLKSRRFLVFLLIAAAAGVVLWAPWAGGRRIGWSDAFGDGDPLLADIFWKIRLPRTLAACLAGGALALGGAAFQALFRNPLAEPFTLGVSAGASAGAALSLYLGGGWLFLGVLPGETLSAFAGALASTLAVYALSRRRSDSSHSSLLLSGVAANFFFSSLVLLLQHLADPGGAARIFRATIGGLSAAGREQALLALPFACLGAALVGAHCRELDLMACGEETALSRGVDTGAARRRLFLGVSLMVGGITALCGPIGFVGLAAPHFCRRLLGPGHRLLLPASALAGSALLVLADTLAKNLLAPAEIPVGVVSSLLGAPFFVWLLLRRGGAGDGGFSL